MLIKTYKSNIFSNLFAISYCLIFFNFLELPYEVWPYYALPILFKTLFRVQEIIIYLIIGCFALLSFLLYEDSQIFLDLLFLFILIRTCFVVNEMELKEKLAICSIFEIFIIISILVGLLQLQFPQVIEVTYQYFSARPEQSVDLLYNLRRSALLIGSEPSYTGIHLLSMLLFISLYRNHYYRFIFYSTIIVILTKSIVVIFGVSLFIIYIGLIHKKKIMTLILIFIAMLFCFIFFESFKNILYRFVYFVSVFIESGDLLEAESKLGSIRLLQMYKSLMQIFIFEYSKPFSVLGTFSMILMSPILAVATLLLICKICRSRPKIFPFIFVSLFGPVLLWPLLYLFLERKK